MKKNFLAGFFAALIILLLLNITFGTYFEGYEAVISALVGNEFSSKMDFSFFVPGWFCVFPFFSILSHYLNSLSGYSWGTTSLNLYILTCFTSCIILIINSKSLRLHHAFLFYAIFFLVIAENLVYVYNLRISIFSLTTAYLLSYVIQKYSLRKWNYLLVASLVVIGILARLEIALITSVIFMAFSILFDKKSIRFSLSVLLLSTATFVFFKSYIHLVYPQHEVILIAEHEFDDKGSISPDDFKDKRTILKMEAMAQFIQDDDVYTIKDYENLLFAKSLTEYVRLEKFPGIYVQKLVDLWNDLKPYIPLFCLTLVIGSFTVFLLLKEQKNKLIQILKIVGFLGFLVVLILALNIDIICPHNFIVSIFSLITLASTIYLLNNFHPTGNTGTFLFIFLIGYLLVSSIHFSRIHSLEQARNQKAKVLRTLLEDLVSQNYQIVFATGSHYDNYPSRLFSGTLKQKINHYYADFFLSRYPFFMKHNQEFFGMGYSRMKSKISAIADRENVVYLSNDNYNRFLAEYVYFFHGLTLHFEPVKTGTDLTGLYDWKAYRMHVGND